MGRPQSSETKQRIGESLKKAHQRKNMPESPTAKMRQHLSDNFALGHPDGKAPTRVRNFGSLGRDVIPMIPQSRMQRELEERQKKEQDLQNRIQQSLQQAQTQSSAISPPVQSNGVIVKPETRRAT